MSEPKTDGVTAVSCLSLLAALRQARADLDNAFHKFPEDQPAPARLFINWIRSIHAIDVTIAEVEKLAAGHMWRTQHRAEAADGT